MLHGSWWFDAGHVLVALVQLYALNLLACGVYRERLYGSLSDCHASVLDVLDCDVSYPEGIYSLLVTMLTSLETTVKVFLYLS